MASKNSTNRRPRESHAARVQWLKKALGADIVIPLGGRQKGSSEFLGLSTFVHRRLVSRGGRPSDPSWTLRRLVPFSGDTWRRLTAEAQRLSNSTRRLTAAQLAAIFIERQLASGSR